MNESQSSEFPMVITFRAYSSGISYSLVYYRRRMHLAEFKQGRHSRFLYLDRENLCFAFGKKAGDRIWRRLGAMR